MMSDCNDVIYPKKRRLIMTIAMGIKEGGKNRDGDNEDGKRKTVGRRKNERNGNGDRRGRNRKDGNLS